jgi:hypothetical protein
VGREQQLLAKKSELWVSRTKIGTMPGLKAEASVELRLTTVLEEGFIHYSL